MGLELRQQLRLTQQLVLTPQLQQAIKLLQLSRLELLDAIKQEMEENPLLEDAPEEVPSGDGAADKLIASPQELSSLKPVTVEETARADIDWSNYLEEYNAPGPIYFEAEERETPEYENFFVRRQSLNEHLLWQLLLSLPNKKEEKIGSAIIGNLNKDGYLQATVDEIATLTGEDATEVEKVLSKMQSFDPLGVCARDLKECLLIQARQLGLEDSIVVPIIQNHLKHLENKNYKMISRALGVPVDDVLAAVEIIIRMEPKPGRQFNDEDPQYISPDVFVYKVGDEFVVMLNEDGMPKLRVNSFYREALKKGGGVPDQTKDYIQNKLRSAVWLIRSIHQRQRTIYKVVESIITFQRDFLEKGIVHLKPMVLRDVAEDIGMHESTVSRVTTNKYVHTPQGIFELKFFFNSSISRFDGEAIASASVKEKIRQIIESEDPAKPYSDKKMVEILKASNINIARRTVAKYREMLGVLPSNKRKQIRGGQSVCKRR
ncbi:MAG: RNA polymerase factor sigma-54 [Deltaproteobacteria bacterium]|nr:RNA polymerase factor sigma-54 [Deltaproteobacteria bacterium]MBW2018462.1 RNA polymerase factor sigma-54 [Deltaproteobacteria bacterium]MBW2074119.1 RNA polymerase factor sigma-54 [Deltaproteobacteria bacterium]RLB83619.1 MAG: RNA polymerase sigma-54 factor [Deltaproteobacteria bacterium]